MLDLTAIGSTKANNSSGFASIHKGNKKESVSYRSQSNNPDLSVIGTFIDPGQRRIPIKLSSRSQGDSMLAEIGNVLAGVEIYEHALL